MRTSAQLVKYGRLTGCPTRDYPGSVEISVRFVTTRTALKLCLGLAVLFCYVPAFGALPAGVARVNGDQHHTGESGLVLQEREQLRERPGMQKCTLLAPGLDPFTDARKIFEFQPALGAFSFGNDLLRNTVIDVTGKSLLLAREFLETPLGGARLLLLKFRPQPTMPVAHRLEFRSRIPLSIGVAGDVGNPKIHPQELRGADWRIGRKVYCAVQVELPLAVDQIGLPLDAAESLFLVLSINQWNDYAAFWECPQTDLINTLKTENPLVIGDGSVGFEGGAFVLVAAEALDGFPNGANGHLRRETEAVSNLPIGQFMYRGLAEDLGVRSTTGGECRRLIYALHGRQQAGSLFGVRQEFQLERQFHYLGVYHSLTDKASASSAWPKPAVSALEDL